MKLGFASDHRGYNLKSALIDYFKAKGYEIIDCGTNSVESCDYPDYAYKLGELINKLSVDLGVAICGSGIGISIALNKIQGVYCAKVNNSEEAKFTRLDNNTNCVAFGEKTDFNNAVDIVNTFIKTEFSNIERHNRRIKKIKDIEKGKYHA